MALFRVTACYICPNWPDSQPPPFHCVRGGHCFPPDVSQLQTDHDYSHLSPMSQAHQHK